MVRIIHFDRGTFRIGKHVLPRLDCANLQRVLGLNEEQGLWLLKALFAGRRGLTVNQFRYYYYTRGVPPSVIAPLAKRIWITFKKKRGVVTELAMELGEPWGNEKRRKGKR